MNDGSQVASVLSSASEQAAVLTEVAWVLIAGASTIFVLTMLLLGLGLRRHKRSVPTGWWVVGGGIAFPVVVLSALLLYSTLRTAGLDRPPADPLVVGVTAHMWWWEIRYRDPASGREVRSANELRLPAGRPVQLGLASEDVIHSVWVPALGGKMDTVPGRINRLVITAREPGVYRGACAEFCGEQHARMALHVVVLRADEFDRWLAAQAQPAAPAAGDTLAARGASAFVAQGCAGCHTVRGLTEGAALGPDLTHVGSRLWLGAGVLRNERGAGARWIASVQALKPNARMPSFAHLDAATLEALGAYMEHLK
jgi:cytochrome c oxidase subunit 2